MQHYLSSRSFNDIPVSHLFVEYKHWITTTKPFPNVATELEALANSRENYRKIIGSPLDTPLGAFWRFLEIFDVGTVSPLLMVVVEATPSESELKAMLCSLESYILRRTVCQLPTNAYNRVFLTLASNLKKEGINSATLTRRLSMLSGESSVWPADADFGSAFTGKAGYYTLSQARIVYILKSLNDAVHTARSESVTINSALTIEHLLPQAWIEHWPLPDGTMGMTSLERFTESLSSIPSKRSTLSAQRDTALQGIGNLTLLTQPLNSAISNGPWSAKRQEIWNHSLLVLNKSIVAKESWDEEAIKKRASELLSLALGVWIGPTPQAASQETR